MLSKAQWSRGGLFFFSKYFAVLVCKILLINLQLKISLDKPQELWVIIAVQNIFLFANPWIQPKFLIIYMYPGQIMNK